MKVTTTRRRFLGMTAAAGGGCIAGGIVSLTPARAVAEPFGVPLGLQLYSVREQLKQDFGGTLDAIGALGYREVEAAGFYGKSAGEVRRAMAPAGLRCVSSHAPYSALAPRLAETLEYLKGVGAEYLICSSPGQKTQGGTDKLTLEDWRWNAGEFNRIGKICAKAGIRFGYHNHTAEFTRLDGLVPYEELLRLTDPATVTMEMDCGWVLVGGGDPVFLMKQHRGRFSMLHVKDFKGATPPGSEPSVTELGHGTVDLGPIFAEAKASQQIRHVFVEQEEFDKPYQQSLKMDAEYLKRFS